MRGKNSFSPPVVGGGSLLVIFAVLCLTVFAMLSLSTAEAGTRISQKSADAVSEYYELDARAEETLARLRRGEKPRGVSADGDVYSYAESNTGKTQKLEVRVRISNGTYEVLQWQLVSTADWKPDTHKRVWDGGTSTVK